MFQPPDIRFKADGRQTIHAWKTDFPLSLQVLRPTAAQALADARRVVDHLRSSVVDKEFTAARLSVPDLDTDDGRGASEFLIQQKSSREVRLQITFVISLNLEGTGGFWAQAAAIAAAADFLQSFALRPHEKGIEIDVQQGRVLKKGELSSEMKGETTT